MTKVTTEPVISKPQPFATGIPLRLNAFPLILSAPKFFVFIQPILDNSELKPLREKIGKEWFLHWRDGAIYGIPRVERPRLSFGKAQQFRTDEYQGLSLLNARANELLPTLLPKYDPLPGRKRFRFLARKKELVHEIVKDWDRIPSLVHSFKIRPRFACETRLIELKEGELQIVLVLGVAMNWSVEAPLDSLQDSGLNLAGLHIIRRKPVEGERQLIGRIASLEDGRVILEESFENIASIATNAVQLEGSKAVFARCLTALLGDRYDEFNNRREALESQFLTGAGLNNCLIEFLKQFRKAKGLQLTTGLTATIGEQISLGNSEAFTTAMELDPVEYCFDTAKTKRDEFAWSGLTQFGPYSRDSFPRRSPRLLIVCPDATQNRVEQALRHLRDGIPGTNFSKGFVRAFDLVNPRFDFCPVPLRGLGGREKTPAQLYYATVEKYLASQSQYDAALVVIQDEHAQLPDAISPYLFAKAILLTNGIPVQEARTSTIFRRPDNLPFIFQNLSVAFYAKMGGVPWTVNHDLTVNDEIVIGMGIAEISGSRFEERQRHVGITTVFRGDGNYLLANVSKECRFEDYQKVLKETMIEVLQEVRERNGWRSGDTVRVVFHASKPLRNLEVDALMAECVAEAAPEQNVQFAFLDILHEHPFQVFDYRQKGQDTGKSGTKGTFAPPRGLLVHLGKNTRLLCTNGPRQIKRATTPLPTPLLIHLHPYSTGCDLTYLTDQVLKFTSLTWRSTQPAQTPVTIYYSELIAKLLVRLKKVPGWSPVPLNSKLRSSKWFL